VEFETPEEALTAINTLNGVEMGGRTILVREDREDRDVKQVGAGAAGVCVLATQQFNSAAQQQFQQCSRRAAMQQWARCTLFVVYGTALVCQHEGRSAAGAACII
jgi:RNA recognition motif-containing protein